jgi:hypothetical protein
MKAAALPLLIVLCLVHASCTGTKGSELTTRLSPAQLGKTITVEGTAENRKDGAVLRGEHFELWISGLSGWPDSDTKRVRATGVLAEDHGRPVFVRRPDEPIVQGVEVPEGTDLEKASRRWVLKDVRWQRLP